MTSHAALVARGWGKCCIVGAGHLHVDAAAKKAKISGSDEVLQEGDVVTLNGTKGNVTKGLLHSWMLLRIHSLSILWRSWISSGPWRAYKCRYAADARIAVIMEQKESALPHRQYVYGEGSDQPLFC